MHRVDRSRRTMRLLNSRSVQVELLHTPPARYAVVSHRWGDESEEVLFTDIGEQARALCKAKGFFKIRGACNQAMQDELDYVWLDTCCVDRRNSVELSEAINSMYNWYRRSTVCYAYLYDVSKPDLLSEFIESDWFSRGWTLQELIAPRVLKFYTKDWQFIGTREELLDPIAERTGISPDILRSGEISPEVTISQKMVWMAKRETSKSEDMSYSMLGILGISMVPIYGIGDDAFENLQHRLISKHSDQTLFAWYHSFISPEDVEMVDVGRARNSTPGPNLPPDPLPTSTLASNPAFDSSPDPATESAELDANTPPLNITGLLASSPSNYLKAYEIPERDFRKHYVDDIQEFSYRSQFSISNNMIRISLPMKHVVGRLWKAVLRCSFEPPRRDQIQRPLVIYLKEIQSPWTFVRVHIAPEDEEMGNNQTNVERGIPGSLERLKDTEMHLHGYTLRDIDIVARDGQSTSDDPPKEPLSDPHFLPPLKEAVRVANLPRHPPGAKTINILVCGEPGVASGRVINFMLGYTVLKPLTDYDRETMAITVIDATLQSRQIRILYVLGPRDPYLELKHYPSALRNMHQLVQLVHETGGIHLMVMCMVSGQPTAMVENNYQFFYKTVCCEQVPMNLVVTGLGKAPRMEDWWERNKGDPVLHQIAQRIVGYACITVLQGDDDAQGEKYRVSREKMQRIVRDFIARFDLPASEKPRAYCPNDLRQWFVALGRRAMDFLLPGQRTSLERGAVKKSLMEVINMSDLEADDVVQQLFDDRPMQVSQLTLQGQNFRVGRSGNA